MPANSYSFAKFTQEKQQKYLDSLRNGFTRDASARKAGVSYEMVRKYGKHYPPFKEEEIEAATEGCESQIDKVEDSLYLKCLEGNVTAMVFYLLNRRPHKWRDMRGLQIRSLEDVINLLPPDIGRELRERLTQSIPTEGERIPTTGKAEEAE